MEIERSKDAKAKASQLFTEVIAQTRHNYPNDLIQPLTDQLTSWTTADGIGTKAEIAERLYNASNYPGYFRTLPRDAIAMVEGDALRIGGSLYGVTLIIDYNSADPRVAGELARGTQEACDESQIVLMNGETAELGYRTSGYGSTHVNINAVGTYKLNSKDAITGEELKPGMPVVGLRETSLRSNGYTRARQIVETSWLHEHGYLSKEDYISEQLRIFIREFSHGNVFPINLHNAEGMLSKFIGHNFSEQVLVPWHLTYPDVAKALLKPSTLYSRVFWDARNEVDITAAAHITGGGIPEKGARMMERSGLGLHLEPTFPLPEAIKRLSNLAKTLPTRTRNHLIDDRIACEQWNQGIGMLVVFADTSNADRFIEIAQANNRQAAIVGEVIPEPVIEFHGHSWKIS